VPTPVTEAEREAWANLAARYRWLYNMSLQERLALPHVHKDITRWWCIGGKRETPLPEMGNKLCPQRLTLDS
jgi:hypothetical protein